MHDGGGVGEAMCTCGGQRTALLVSSPLLPLLYGLGNRTQVVWKLLIVWKSRAHHVFYLNAESKQEVLEWTQEDAFITSY